MRPRFLFTFMLCLLLIPLFSPGCAGATKEKHPMARIDPEIARAKVQAGKALMVCAYDDEKCGGMLIEGAMLRSTFESRAPSLSKDQEIIFY